MNNNLPKKYLFTLTNSIKISYQYTNKKLLGAIFFTLFIPAIYLVVRFYVIGTLNGPNNFSIAGNLAWINVIFEILEEAFLLPLFFMMGTILRKSKSLHKNEVQDHKKQSLKGEEKAKINFLILLITVIYTVFIIFLIIFTNQLLVAFSVPNVTSTITNFVRIEFFSRLAIMLTKIGFILLLIKNKWKEVLFVLLIQTVTNIILDFFIAANTSFSLNLGVLWIAWNQLISASLVAFIYLFLIIKIYDYKWTDWKIKNSLNWKVARQIIYSGSESFVRNAFFIFFVLKTINRLQSGSSQGDFWVTNSFIWTWLLMPVFMISQYLNRSQAFDKATSLKIRMPFLFLIIFATIILWFILIPAYEPLVRIIFNNNNSQLIAHLVIISLGFYVLMAINEPIDKIFYGEGKAQYMLWQSLFTNIVIYLPFYFLVETLTIEMIAIMFGSAILTDSVLTILMGIWWYKFNGKENKFLSTKLNWLKSKSLVRN